MDTIVYLSYAKNNKLEISEVCSFSIKERLLQDYRLIQILIMEQAMESCAYSEDKKLVGSVHNKSWCRRICLDIVAVGRWLEHRRRLHIQEKAHLKMSEQLKQELATYLNERDEIFLCYDESVKQGYWVKSVLPFKVFDAYLERDWVYRLLEEAVHPHFVVLGDVPYSKEMFCKLAPRMKSLYWIAPDRTAEEELEDFAEDFYQETGLAIRLQFLPADTTYGQLVIPNYQVKEPANILDFTDGKYIPRFEPPEGSIWLNCSANSDKERRIEARRLLCRVISLRKQWKKIPFA